MGKKRGLEDDTGSASLKSNSDTITLSKTAAKAGPKTSTNTDRSSTSISQSKSKAEPVGSEPKRLKMDPDANQTLYLNNLNDKINPDLLRHSLYLLCSSYGDVIDIIIKPKSKRMRGQAHIIFSNVSEATSALYQLPKFTFFQKPMRVQYATKKSTIIKRIEMEDE